MDENETLGVCYKQPTSLPERISVADDFVARFAYALPLWVDRMDNAAEEAYAAWPERLYIINEDGAIAYKGRTGPYGFLPEEVEAWLEERFGGSVEPDEVEEALQ